MGPNGILHLGPTDPRIQFHATTEEIERRLTDPTVRLESFIVSNTPSRKVRMLGSMDQPAMAAWHILFEEENKDTYVRTTLESVAAQ